MTTSHYYYGGITKFIRTNFVEHPKDMHIFDMSYEAEPFESDDIQAWKGKVLKLTDYFDRNSWPNDELPRCKIITSGFAFENSNPYYITGTNNFNIVPNWAEIVSWKTRFFHDAVTERHDLLKAAGSFMNQLSTDKLIVCFMHRPKPHRMGLMQLLVEKDIWDDSEIRFLNHNQMWQDFAERFMNQDLEHTYMEELPLDFIKILISKASYFLAPFKYWEYPNLSLDPCYNRGLFDIVAETHGHSNMITQKTCQPILWKKPFCLMGNANQNTLLKDMGFELFEEYFDYSAENKNLTDYNDPEDFKLHYSKLLKNIWDIDRSEKSYIQITSDVAEKTDHNLNIYMKILFDDSIIPSEIAEFKGDTYENQVLRSRSIVKADPYYQRYLP